MPQTEIARYAVWLFGHSVRPGENLPELYDLLCLKNPSGSETLDYREFEQLFERWRWQRLDGDHGGMTDPDTGPPAAAGQPRAVPCDYHVATAFLLEELIDTVRELLSEGWQPLGGIAQSRSGSGAGYWAQALIKTGG